MTVALLDELWDETDDSHSRPDGARAARREPLRTAARFERTSLERYHTHSRFRRKRKVCGPAAGLHRRGMKRVASGPRVRISYLSRAHRCYARK
jgi:hypothetical protein